MNDAPHLIRSGDHVTVKDELGVWCVVAIVRNLESHKAAQAACTQAQKIVHVPLHACHRTPAPYFNGDDWVRSRYGE